MVDMCDGLKRLIYIEVQLCEYFRLWMFSCQSIFEIFNQKYWW